MNAALFCKQATGLRFNVPLSRFEYHVVRVLDRIFPREQLPFGWRWRIAGSYVSPGTDTSASWLKRGLWWPFKQCGVYLHRIDREDLDRHLHNHPANFGSWVICGGTREDVLTLDGAKGAWHRTLEYYYHPRSNFHRITYLPGRRAWTLFFMGKPLWMVHPDTGEQVHRWGFNVDGKFVDWVTYRKEYGRE